MAFHVHGGELAGSYDAVLLSTDLEADDAVAIRALAPRLRGVPILVVVGEGDKDKRQFVSDLLASYDLDRTAEIVQGRRSATPFPEALLSAYRGERPSAAKIFDPCSDEEVAARVVAFLSAHAAPFALLLKPPHELLNAPVAVLGRTVGALYGSFNLVVLRRAMQEAHPERDEGACFAVQEQWLHTFKALLWVERSASVGRDCVLDPNSSPEAWPPILADHGLATHISQWNSTVLREFSHKVSQKGAEMLEALSSAEGSQDASFEAVERVAEGAEKNIAIMLSIARTKGQQVGSPAPSMQRPEPCLGARCAMRTPL